MIDPVERVKEHLLERLQFELSQVITYEALVRLDDDYIRNQIIARVRAFVYAERLHVETRAIPVTAEVSSRIAPRHVMIEIPLTWWGRLLRRKPRREWLPVVGDAVVHDETVTVNGSAQVRANYFAAFPDIRTRFPEGFGDVVRWVETENPYEYSPHPWEVP
jgi:hypothetical protein